MDNVQDTLAVENFSGEELRDKARQSMERARQAVHDDVERQVKAACVRHGVGLREGDNV